MDLQEERLQGLRELSAQVGAVAVEVEAGEVMVTVAAEMVAVDLEKGCGGTA